MQIDTTPPSVNKVEHIGPTNIDIYFDEFVDEQSASVISNYSIDKGIGSPLVAYRDTDASVVHLILANPIADGVLYTLTVFDVEDTMGILCLHKIFHFRITSQMPLIL